MMRTIIFATALVMSLLGSGVAVQRPDDLITEQALQDAARVKRLTELGVRLEGKHVVLWFAPALGRGEAESLVARLDLAVAELKRRIGQHEWQNIGSNRITFYLVDEPRFPAHGTDGAVFTSIASIRANRTMFLTRAATELLRPKGPGPGDETPVWIVFGLTSYLATTVAQHVGFVESDFLGAGTPKNADQLCAAQAATPEGTTMLAYIGTSRRPAELYGADVGRYQSAFYSCSLSFTKYLIEQLGLEGVIDLTPAVVSGQLESELARAAKRPVDEMKRDWGRSIGI